jgi:hypothetical protein
MTATLSLPLNARLGDRELPVGWAWFRPEPQVGDTVRLPTAPSGKDGWQSFRVVGKQIRPTRMFDGAGESADGAFGRAIHLDVEPFD